MIFIEIPEFIRGLHSELTVLKKKKVWKRAKIFLLPAQAKVAPPISSTLGQFGINLLHFCEKFNTVTKNLDPEIPLSVSVTVFSDKTFRFNIKLISLNEMFFSFGLSNTSLKDLYYSVEKKNHFLVNLYKIYLCSSHQAKVFNNFLPTKDSVKHIKLLSSYFKSYKHNHNLL